MTNIEQKALALVNEVARELGWGEIEEISAAGYTRNEAIFRAIEQHEATKQEFDDFKQEVSDTIQAMLAKDGAIIRNYLDRFIIPAPKPDPLEEILREIDHAAMWVDECAKEIRASLDARGFEIREKG